MRRQSLWLPVRLWIAHPVITAVLVRRTVLSVSQTTARAQGRRSTNVPVSAPTSAVIPSAVTT